MKKILLLFIFVASLVTTKAQCPYDDLVIKQNISRNVYSWDLYSQSFFDTCVKITYRMYNIRTKREVLAWSWTDKKMMPLLISDKLRCYMNFPNKGEYVLVINLKNSCIKPCDTFIYRYIEMNWFNHCSFNYTLYSTDAQCSDAHADSISAYMTKGSELQNDTCWAYWTQIFYGVGLNNISDFLWTDRSYDAEEEIMQQYDFRIRDLIYESGPDVTDRYLDYRFENPGRYLILSYWGDKCRSDDTIILTRINIAPCETVGVVDLNTPKAKLIEIYDMMGRPINEARENEIIIYRYSNGSTHKIIRK